MSFAVDLRTSDLCFIDTETTGPNFGHHELIEIAAIRTNADARIEKGIWHRKILPLHPERVTKYAQALTGYQNEQHTGERSSVLMWREFASFARGCVPVCHNPSFDRSFISLAASSAGVFELGLDYHWIGTETLAWPLFKSGGFAKLSLVTLCNFLGIEEEPPVHNALNGASTCRRVYLALMERFAQT